MSWDGCRFGVKATAWQPTGTGSNIRRFTMETRNSRSARLLLGPVRQSVQIMDVSERLLLAAKKPTSLVLSSVTKARLILLSKYLGISWYTLVALSTDRISSANHINYEALLLLMETS